MNNKKLWFDVDRDGFRQLQSGKKKTFIINEICQNAFDENITYCKLDIKSISDYEIYIVIVDDSPEGFKDIRHAYTLFADTYKRRDADKRGRFNLGEKQIISICNSAKITTTTGEVSFDDRGRTESMDHTEKGTVVELFFSGSRKECQELIDHAKQLLIPPNIKFYLNDELIPSKPVYKVFEVSLMTQILTDNQMTTTRRKTAVNLVPSNGQSYIYEMGIPVQETDCQWHIDVQQKIPLCVDRETIPDYYLKDLYAEVLNNTHQDVPEDHSSDLWVRTGMTDERIKKEPVLSILTKRFGDKFLFRSTDKHANEEAIINEYELVSNKDLSKEERDQIKQHGLYQSSSDVFDTTSIVNATKVRPTIKQSSFVNFAKRVAKEFLDIDVTVYFVEAKGSTTKADYCPSTRTLRYNLSYFEKYFFDTLSWENIDLLIHELAHECENFGIHENGPHINHDYHKTCTMLAGKLIMKALQDPSFFEVD